MDLRAAEDAILPPGGRALVATGFAIALPHGFEAQVRPRSGLAAKHGVTVLNAPGTIDADYRGEIKVILINHGEAAFAIKRGDRIAQMVVAPVTRVVLEETGELSMNGARRGRLRLVGQELMAAFGRGTRTLCPAYRAAGGGRAGPGQAQGGEGAGRSARAGLARRCCSISPPPASARSASSMTTTCRCPICSARSSMTHRASATPKTASAAADAQRSQSACECGRRTRPASRRANALDIIGQYDIVADGSDNFATRFLVSDACYLAKKTLVAAAVGQFDGQLSTFKPHLKDAQGVPYPTYRCLHPEAPPRGLCRPARKRASWGR